MPSPYLVDDEKISALARALRRYKRPEEASATSLALAVNWRLDEAARLLPRAIVVERARRSILAQRKAAS